MNFKKNLKRFMTLNRHHAEGFTLVELIVVIAILAILGGVAVPAYGGYVKKANMTADQALISEVSDALLLYYYSNPGAVTSAVVKLGPNGAIVEPGNAAYDAGVAALAAVFGESWQTATALKYDGWNGVSSTVSYGNSSYHGRESSLIQTVDKLTTALGNVAVDPSMANILFDSEFGKFLDDKGVNKTEGKSIGNAAVLYVAQQTKGKESDIQDAFNTVLGPNGTVNPNTVNSIYTELLNKGFGEVAATAAIYAYAEGYAQSTGQADKFHENMKFDGVNDGATAAGKLAEALGTLTLGDDFSNYVAEGQGAKDLKGYVDMMGTVLENENIISDINDPEAFTDGTVENLLKGHAAMSNLSITTNPGEVAVVLTVDENGAVMTHVAPMNWNK